MKNNLLWGAIILVVVIFGAVILSNSSPAPKAADTSTAATQTESTNTTSTKTATAAKPAEPIDGMKTSLGGIFDEKGSYECDYDSLGQQSRTSNVVYIADGKMRGEFRTINTQGTQASIVVYDGSYLYVWTEGQAKGTVSQPKTLKDLPGIIPEDVSSGRILGTSANNVSWMCHAWSKNSSMLAKPSYVVFN